MKRKSQELFQLACDAMERAGARPAMARAAARHLVAAEEHGLPTHGMSRVPFYCSMLKNGRAHGNAHPVAKSDSGAVILIDNADGLPYESCSWAIAEVIARARRNVQQLGLANVAILRAAVEALPLEDRTADAIDLRDHIALSGPQARAVAFSLGSGLHVHTSAAFVVRPDRERRAEPRRLRRRQERRVLLQQRLTGEKRLAQRQIPGCRGRV